MFLLDILLPFPHWSLPYAHIKFVQTVFPSVQLCGHGSDSFLVLGYSNSPLSLYPHPTPFFSISWLNNRGFWFVVTPINILQFYLKTIPCNFQMLSANPKVPAQISLCRSSIIITSNKSIIDIPRSGNCMMDNLASLCSLQFTGKGTQRGWWGPEDVYSLLVCS